MARFNGLAGTWLIPGLAAVALFATVAMAVAPTVREAVLMSPAGIMPDDAATIFCERCGKISSLIGHRTYRCAFCRHEQELPRRGWR